MTNAQPTNTNDEKVFEITGRPVAKGPYKGLIPFAVVFNDAAAPVVKLLEGPETAPSESMWLVRARRHVSDISEKYPTAVVRLVTPQDRDDINKLYKLDNTAAQLKTDTATFSGPAYWVDGGQGPDGGERPFMYKVRGNGQMLNAHEHSDHLVRAVVEVPLSELKPYLG